MRRTSIPRSLIASAALAAALAGCVEAPVAPAPRAAPRPAAWQQFCEQAWNVSHASSLVAARGNEGWELVAMYNGVLCYKRPLAESPPQRAPNSGVPTPAATSPNGAPNGPVMHDPGF